ncbi:MAG: DUF2004 domain-containing protein [Litoreibacter sp.]
MANEKREKIALSTIKSYMGTPEGEDCVILFVEHHLEELEADYFSRTYGTTTPAASQMLSSLVLVSSWSYQDDGNIDVFDFSLPGEVTDYVLSVRFSGGDVEEISMES